MTEFSFTVYGVPIPKGSAKAFMPRGARFPVVTHDNKKTKPWQQLVADGASQALRGAGVMMTGPVFLRVTFFLPRPKSLPKSTTAHLKKPDLDKLVRAVKDALTKVIWQDDSQVTQLNAWKYYAAPGESPRAVIHVVSVRGVLGMTEHLAPSGLPIDGYPVQQA